MALCVAAINPATQVQAAMLEESEDNGSPATADKLPLNTWVQGSMDAYYDQDWYQITILKGNGYTEVEIKLSLDNSSWNVYLYDSNRHELRSWTAHSYKDIILGLMTGKYFIKVSEYNGTGVQGTYNLIANYTKSNQWEKEQYSGYKTLKNANISYLSKTYTGTLYSEYDVDYYRFKLNGTNKVSLRFMIDDSVSNPGLF